MHSFGTGACHCIRETVIQHLIRYSGRHISDGDMRFRWNVRFLRTLHLLVALLLLGVFLFHLAESLVLLLHRIHQHLVEVGEELFSRGRRPDDIHEIRQTIEPCVVMLKVALREIRSRHRSCHKHTAKFQFVIHFGNRPRVDVSGIVRM